MTIGVFVSEVSISDSVCDLSYKKISFEYLKEWQE